MGFLIKCVLCIALVYVAVQWRSAPSSHPRAAVHTATRTRADPAPAPDATARKLLQAGAESLTVSAREWCLSAPSDCLAMIQRTQTKPR